MYRALVASLLAVCSFAGPLAHAQASLLDEVQTIAAADTGVPVEQSFDISVAGTYQLTLTDLGAPSAPVASIKLAITSGATIVGTPLTGAGTLQFKATAGTYVVRVIGAPGTGAGSGAFGVEVKNMADNTQVLGFAGALAPPGSAVSANESILDSTFTVTDAGNYQVTLSDFQLPQSLDALTLALVQQGASSLITTLTVTGGTPSTATVSLQPNITYSIFAVGQAATAVNAGLYGVLVRESSSGAVVFSRSVSVGGVSLLGSATLSAGSYTLSLADLAYPAALAQSGAALALAGQPVTQLAAPGHQTFTAVAGTYQAFGLGTPSASPGTGSYAVQVQPSGSGPAALSMAQAVSSASSATTAYSFNTNLATAGSYSAQLADFAFPAALTSVTLAVVQGTTILGSPQVGPGNLTINPAVGELSLLVFAQSAAVGGLFGVNVTPSAGSTPVFETTQGVGKLFTAQKVSVTTAGSYDVTVTDVGFPASFSNLAVVVTRGTSAVGSIFGGGKFSFSATSGNYFINFIAQPTGTDEAGTYGISVAPTPPAPIVTLTSDATRVPSGGMVTLTWSSQNATSCSATGGWSGAQPLSGTLKSAALTAATTFTLSCAGAGGTVTQSVSIAVTAPTGGGGGALDVSFLSLLLVFAARNILRGKECG